MRSLRPAPPLLYSLLLLTLPAGMAPFFPPAATIWWSLLLLLFGATAWDLLQLLRTAQPTLLREVSTSLAIGRAAEVHLTLLRGAATDERSKRRGGLRQPLRTDITDHYPTIGQAEGLPRRVDLPPAGSQGTISYHFTPLVRGEFRFGAPALLLHSPLGLWRRHMRPGREQKVRVYPDFRTVQGYRQLVLEGRDPLMGIRRSRRRGEGTDFEQLREFRSGDPLRKVDWKASARFGKLISRQYTEEHDQQVIFLLDCGYRISGSGAEGLSHFDHILNAFLLCAYIALQQGDSVGLRSFGAEERVLPPLKGAEAINQMLNTVYDLQAESVPTDPGAALEEAARKCPRRSLFILLSTLREEDGERLSEAMKAIGGHHLVVLASLREQSAAKLLTPRPMSFDQAVVHAAAVQYIGKREQTMQLLRTRGLMVFEEDPVHLAAALAAQYRFIKSAGLL